MADFEVLTLISLFVTVFFSWVYARHKRMNILEKNGIPGPPRNFILGNIREILTIGMPECAREWHKKYGSVFGYYIGGNPHIMVSDLDFIRMVEVKDFKNFSYRPHIPMGTPFPQGPDSVALTNKDWQRQRKLLNANFTSHKFRGLVDTINLVIHDTIEKDLQRAERANAELDISFAFQKLTLCTTASNFFGVSHESFVNVQENDPLAKAFRDSSGEPQMFDPLSIFMVLFPEFQIFVYPFRMAYLKFINYMSWTSMGIQQNFAEQVIQNRIDYNQNPENPRIHDILQFMLDAKEEGSKLSFKEIVSNSMVFMGAGFETTSSTMAFAVHFLLNHPELQEKLRDEVMQSYEKEKKIDYDSVFSMPLMTAFINETIRLIPAVPNFIQRQALDDYQYKDYKIPKGTAIHVAALQINYDEKYWKDPSKFQMERFLNKDYDPVAFQGFGGGPRYCLGQRLAYLIMKLTLSHVLLKYKLLPGPSTEIGNLALDERIFTTVPKKGVFCRVSTLSAISASA